MKAFIASSFDPADEQTVRTIEQLIESGGDIQCVSGRKAQAEAVDEKITELIRSCDFFVAIFTREALVVPKERDTFLRRAFYTKDRSYTTSAWVIQESGFALGCGKRIVLLVEDGVLQPPQLQGNLEYVNFDRDCIEKISVRLNQILSDIKSALTPQASGKVATETPPQTKTQDQAIDQTAETVVADESAGHIEKVFHLMGEGDFAGAKQLFYGTVQPQLEENRKLFFEAFMLRLAQRQGDDSAITELARLAAANPASSEVWIQLAHCYNTISEPVKAKEAFIRAKEAYHADDATDRDNIVLCSIEAARCDSKSDRYPDAIASLKRLLADTRFSDHRARILSGMASIANESDMREAFICYAEGSLEADPLDTGLRFQLAYAYSQGISEKLAVFHYQKLLIMKQGAYSLNNLGVSYGRLKLNCKSIDTYRQAVAQDNTLAMANLAHKFLDGGFRDEARGLISKAHTLETQGQTIDPNVASAAQKLANMEREEEKNEQSALKDAKKERTFRLQYADAFLSETNAAGSILDAQWLTPWGKVTVEVDIASGTFKATAHDRVELPDYMGLMVGASGPPTKYYEDRYVVVEGTVTGLSARYRITVDDKQATTLLGQLGQPKIRSATGYMILSESSPKARIMEKPSDDKCEFPEWTKVSSQDKPAA
jgi:tetratricopeptide (TPR) repeat protein